MNQKDYMLEAIRLAQEGMDHNEGGPFGCVIVKDNTIIGRGHNKVTSTLDPTAHAEMVAIREAARHLNSFQLEDCDLYTSCEPCPMCLGAIYWARIARVYYACTREDAAAIGFDDRLIYDELKKDLSSRLIPMQQLHRETAIDVFKNWTLKEDKLGY
jgi:tRNA(Arg) A34 adenosine deaminase TadA